MQYDFLWMKKPQMEKKPEVDILDMFKPVQQKTPKLQKSAVNKTQQEQHRYLKDSSNGAKKLQKIVGVSKMTPEQIKYRQNMQKSKSQLNATKQSQKAKKFAQSNRKGRGIQIIDVQKIQQERKAKRLQKQEKAKEYAKNRQGNDRSDKAGQQNLRYAKQKRRQKQRQRVQIDQMDDKKYSCVKQKEETKYEQQKRRQKQLMRQSIDKQKRKLTSGKTSNQQNLKLQKKSHLNSEKTKKQMIGEYSEDEPSFGQESSEDWQRQLKKITGYDPNQQKFRKRDREIILDARAGQILREERKSAYFGRKEQEEDQLMEYQLKKKKMKRD